MAQRRDRVLAAVETAQPAALDKRPIVTPAAERDVARLIQQLERRYGVALVQRALRRYLSTTREQRRLEAEIAERQRELADLQKRRKK